MQDAEPLLLMLVAVGSFSFAVQLSATVSRFTSRLWLTISFLKQEEQFAVVSQFSHQVSPGFLVGWIIVIAFADIFTAP